MSVSNPSSILVSKVALNWPPPLSIKPELVNLFRTLVSKNTLLLKSLLNVSCDTLKLRIQLIVLCLLKNRRLVVLRPMKSMEKWSWLGNAAPVVAAGVAVCNHWNHPPRVMETPPKPKEEPSAVALDKRSRVGFELIGRKSLTMDTVLLRFALPSSEHVLGLPSGQHLFCYAVINGETIVRAYSTITPPETKGYFEIALRVYFAGQNERYPLGGKMSQYLYYLPLGSKVEFKGPVGRFTYKGRGSYTRNRTEGQISQISMIAGGTGINPLFQIIKSILNDPLDMTQISLVYANKSEQDIIFHQELDHLAAKHWNLTVYYTIDKASWHWMQGRGLINQKMLEKHLFPAGKEGIVLMCGSGPMTDAMSEICTKSLGWSKDQITVF